MKCQDPRWEEAIARAEELDEQSNMNLVYFFRDELQRIDEGEMASKVLFTSSVKDKLKVFGILEDGEYFGRSGRRTVVSSKGLDLIRKFRNKQVVM